MSVKSVKIYGEIPKFKPVLNYKRKYTLNGKPVLNSNTKFTLNGKSYIYIP